MKELIAELDALQRLPASQTGPHRILLFKRVEAALRACTQREATLLEALPKIRPALREVSLALTAMEKCGFDDPDLRSQYRKASAALHRAVINLEKVIP